MVVVIRSLVSIELFYFQMVWNNVQQLVTHKTYRLLVPLLIFNGFEQGFVYADYNKVCTMNVVLAIVLSYSQQKKNIKCYEV